MLEFLHEKVRIECSDGKTYFGTVVNFYNDFETESGHDEISLQQEDADYELILEEQEVLKIEKIA